MFPKTTLQGGSRRSPSRNFGVNAIATDVLRQGFLEACCWTDLCLRTKSSVTPEPRSSPTLSGVIESDIVSGAARAVALCEGTRLQRLIPQSDPVFPRERRVVSPHALGYLPFENVLKPSVGCIGRCYLAYPGVHKARWLLPAEPSLRRVGLNLLGSGGLERFLGRSLVATGCFRGECIWLDIVPLEIKLARVLREQDLRLAFYLGTPGAYRKLTAQVITTQKHVPAYAKIAEDALARASL